jgi:membrane protein
MAQIQQQIDRLYLALDQRLRGWLSLLLRAALAFDQDNGAVMSRSIAYYALFSLFPLLLVLMSFATSLLATEEAQQLIVELVEGFLPATADLVQANVDQILAAQSTVSILALLGLLWSASGVFTAIYRSVNRAWGNPKSQLFWSEKLFGLAVVILVGLLLVSTTFLSTAVSVLRSWNLTILNWEPFADPDAFRLWGWISTLLPILVSVVTFIILYRTIPRNTVTWRDVWLGGVVAGLVWEMARRLYTWYLANIARYSLIYGSVGAIIGFLLWAYLSAMILLIGAEFTAQYTAWRKAGYPLETRPLGQWMDNWSKNDSQ